MGQAVYFGINRFAKFFEGVAQRLGSASAGFAVAFGSLRLQLSDSFLNGGIGSSANFRVDFGFGSGSRRVGNTTRSPQLVGPHCHWR